jgi:hypothetical protein
MRMSNNQYRPRNMLVEAARVVPETFRDALGLIDHKQLSAAGEYENDREKVYISVRPYPDAPYVMTACNGDWLVRYPDGTLYVTTDPKFHQEYVKTGAQPRGSTNTIRGSVSPDATVVQTGNIDGGVHL